MRRARKLIFDFCFYFTFSLGAFLTFRKEYWFPKMLGGEGECSLIFRDYPNWPAGDSGDNLEKYYLIQLGYHAFTICQSVIVKRKTDRKYYEFLLHHFIATTLILFSLLTNMLAVGVVILFLHDVSDMFADIIRAWVETKYRNIYFEVVTFLLAVGSWFYTRMIVFPFCANKAIIDNLPTEQDDNYKLWFSQLYIAILNGMLIIMHLYWWSWMMIGGYKMLTGKGTFNPHDKKRN